MCPKHTLLATQLPPKRVYWPLGHNDLFPSITRARLASSAHAVLPTIHLSCTIVCQHNVHVCWCAMTAVTKCHKLRAKMPEIYCLVILGLDASDQNVTRVGSSRRLWGESSPCPSLCPGVSGTPFPIGESSGSLLAYSYGIFSVSVSNFTPLFFFIRTPIKVVSEGVSTHPTLVWLHLNWLHLELFPYQINSHFGVPSLMI